MLSQRYCWGLGPFWNVTAVVGRVALDFQKSHAVSTSMTQRHTVTPQKTSIRKITYAANIMSLNNTWTMYTECPGRNVPDFGRMFLKLKYTDITKITYIRSWTVTEIMAREKCGLLAVPRTVPGSRDVLPVHCACPSFSLQPASAFTLCLHM